MNDDYHDVERWMPFFTSYYANIKNIPKSYLCLGISQICPDWLIDNDEYTNFIFVKNKCLAPSMSLFQDYKNDKVSIDEYKKRYIYGLYDILINKLNYYSIPAFFRELSYSFINETEIPMDGIVFLCYETPDKFCHRHLLRRLMNFIYKIPCKEFGINEREVWGFKESDLPPKIKTPLGKPGTENSLF